MPRVLNVKKLEEKFQTLSRSKESIQGLAMWIMHHKEVYVEIVQQWLIGISNDCNTLAMFYVANEIIQGCGKKKCPEFRDAFSNVLEEAVAFDHVKEYKDKILRLLSLWKERNLFDNKLYQSIENKFKETEEVESSDEETDEGEEEESELDIIQKFKKEILIDRLKKLKLLESKRQEKEDILNYADVPELPNLDNIAVRKDCKDSIRKCDAYLKLVENYTKLMSKEISMRKRMLKELNRNCIFYTAQHKDVREVANAFRVYGKRVKLLETKLEEKIATFSSSSYSPSFSESSASPKSGLSSEADDASKNYLSPYNKSDQSFLSGNSNDSFSFSGKVSSRLATEIFGDIKQPERNTDESKISESVCSKEVPPIVKEKTQFVPLVEEQAVTNLGADSGTLLEKEYANFLQCLQTEKDPESKPSPQEKAIFSDRTSTKSVGKEIYSPSEGLLSESNSSLPVELENTPDLKETIDSNQKNSKTKDNEDIDLLLEESFDKKSQTKLNFKRKIELLLKSNAKKHCIEQQTQDIFDIEPTKKIAPLLNLKEKQESKQVNKKEDNKSNSSKVSQTFDAQNSSSSKNVRNTEEILNSKTEAVTKFKTSGIDIGSLGSLIKSVSEKTKPSDKSPIALTCSDSYSADQIKTLPVNTNATFTGIPMSTFVSNKSVSMPSKSTKQPENKTLTFNPTATFTGINVSSIRSMLYTVSAKDAMPTDTKETSESDLVKKKPISTFESNKSVSMLPKNAKQSESETLTFNPTATFTGMNMSSIMSMLSSDVGAKGALATDIKEESSSDLFKEMPMTSFMPKMSADLSTENAKQPENFSKDIPAIASSPTIDASPEVQQQAGNDSFPRIPALSSFMFDMSTDLLKNILKINQQNTVKTESNVEYNEKTLKTEQQAQSNSSDKEVIPLLSNAPIEESFKEDFGDSSQVSNENSRNLMQTLNSISPSEKEKPKDQDSLHNRSIELKCPSPESVPESVKFEDRSIASVKETQEISSFKDRQSTISDNLKCTTMQALDTKPSLLKTLKNVLVCLTENIQLKPEMSSIEKDSELEPPLPIESMLKIYSYVHGCNSDYFSDNSVTPNTVPKTSNVDLHVSSVVKVENNYEVMDMECDSEGETA